MKWIELKRSKIKVYGKPVRTLMKGLVAPEEHTHFLHSLLTNDIKSLKPYTFNYNLWLRQNGQPIADFFVYRLQDYYLLDTEEPAKVIINEFNRLKLSLKVYFEDLTPECEHLFIFGEDSENFVKEILGVSLNDYEVKELEGFFVARNPLRIKAEGYDLIGNLAEVKKLLKEEDRITEEEFEAIRIRNCVPKIRKELREGFSPLEAGVLKYAISMNKGCYVGQEAIARVYFRGRTPRALVRFEVLKPVKEEEKILQDGKEIGLITSVSPKESYALGYLLRAKFKEGEVYETERGEVKAVGVCENGYASEGG